MTKPTVDPVVRCITRNRLRWIKALEGGKYKQARHNMMQRQGRSRVYDPVSLGYFLFPKLLNACDIPQRDLGKLLLMFNYQEKDFPDIARWLRIKWKILD